MISLSIVGEEAFKIYSKAVLKEELHIESNVDELMDELKDDFEDAKAEAEGNFVETKYDNKKAKFKTNNLVLNDSDKKREINYDSNQKFLELKKDEEN